MTPNVELATMPVAPVITHQLPRHVRATEVQLLNEATDEATPLVDDELLDLLAQAGRLITSLEPTAHFGRWVHCA